MRPAPGAATDAPGPALPARAAGRGSGWRQTLRFRLFAATLVALALALLLAGWGLAGLFRDHVLRQFEAALTTQLDQLTARLEFDPAGQPAIDAQTLSDPRWSRPYSGLYWQLDASGAASPQRGMLRSRSLWDASLQVPADVLADGAVHRHEVNGPEGAPLLLLERTLRGPAGSASWRLLVAADLRPTQAAVERFNGILLVSLLLLLALLCAAAVAQVAIGLAPLRALQRALTAVHEGRAQRLAGRFPAEVQPLIDDFNGVLDRNAEVVARARTQAGNLAHAIKTPLAAMSQAAVSAARHPAAAAELPDLVQSQVQVALRQVDWHLARSRAAGAQALPGASVALAPVLAGLLRVMQRVHAERALALDAEPIDADWRFAGEAQDLQEMLGNVIDNACKWARHRVGLSARQVDEGARSWLCVVVDDDGPGIGADRREAVLARGARLDESVPGTGLGLAIVDELVGLYGGSLTLGEAALGGLRVELRLPALVRPGRP